MLAAPGALAVIVLLATGCTSTATTATRATTATASPTTAAAAKTAAFCAAQKAVFAEVVSTGRSQSLSPAVAPAIEKAEGALATMRTDAPRQIRSEVDGIAATWSPVLAELLAGAQHPGLKPPASFQTGMQKAFHNLVGTMGQRIRSWAAAHCPASSTPSPKTSIGSGPSAQATAGSPDGLVTFLDRGGIEVADPVSGTVRLVVPLPSPVLGNSTTGTYMVNGPVWGSAPGIAHPVIYFVLHGLNTTTGPVMADRYDVFFRADPFTGELSVIDANPDATGETSGLASLPGELLFTTGCCEDIGLGGLALTGSGAAGPPTMVESPTAGRWSSLGGVHDGNLAAEHFVMGKGPSYLWVNPVNRSTIPMQIPASLPSSSSVQEVAVSADGAFEALAVVNGSVTSSGVPQGSLDVLDTATGALSLPDSLLGLPSGMAFAPSGPWLAVASGGSVTVVDAAASNGAGAGAASSTGPPGPYHLSITATGAQGLSWSSPVIGFSFDNVVPVHQSVDQLVSQAVQPAPSSG